MGNSLCCEGRSTDFLCEGDSNGFLCGGHSNDFLCLGHGEHSLWRQAIVTSPPLETKVKNSSVRAMATIFMVGAIVKHFLASTMGKVLSVETMVQIL